MAGAIFIVDTENKLTEMHPASFSTEADFQKLLADHPALLGLASGSSGDLLLVSQEFGVMDEEGAADRWSIDHLFLTPEAVPVLVEVKRASDTRARREVVAQMLDYASHGAAYWSSKEIALRYQQTCERSGVDPEIRLQDFLGGGDTDAFWRQVEANLRSGRIRMVFVADRIGKELRRIVEWLNEQLRSAEVLAVEVAQFTSPSGVRTLVPSLIGDTQRAESTKSSSTPHPPSVSDDEWLDSFHELVGAEAGNRAKDAANLFRGFGLRMRLGPTQISAAFDLEDGTGKKRGLFYLYRKGGLIEMAIPYFVHFPQLASEEARQRVLDHLRSAVPGLKVPASGIRSYPRVPLQDLAPADVWRATVLLWKTSSPAQGQADALPSRRAPDS